MFFFSFLYPISSSLCASITLKSDLADVFAAKSIH